MKKIIFHPRTSSSDELPKSAASHSILAAAQWSTLASASKARAPVFEQVASIPCSQTRSMGSTRLSPNTLLPHNALHPHPIFWPLESRTQNTPYQPEPWANTETHRSDFCPQCSPPTGVPVLVPDTAFLIQLPSNTPGKAMGHGPSLHLRTPAPLRQTCMEFQVLGIGPDQP